MFGPSKIMKWFDRNLHAVRRSRHKTLAHIVAGAMKMKGPAFWPLVVPWTVQRSQSTELKGWIAFWAMSSWNVMPSPGPFSTSCVARTSILL